MDVKDFLIYEREDIKELCQLWLWMIGLGGHEAGMMLPERDEAEPLGAQELDRELRLDWPQNLTL